MGELLQRGLVFCVKSLDLVEVLIFGGMIHQSKSCYSLGPSQTSKVDFFAEIVFGCKPLTFFYTRPQLRCLTDSIRRFQKNIEMILHLEKKHVPCIPVCLTLLFQKK